MLNGPYFVTIERNVDTIVSSLSAMQKRGWGVLEVKHREFDRYNISFYTTCPSSTLDTMCQVTGP